MYNAPMPSPNELPSSRQLLRSSIIAFIVATVLMITVVLPAEYGKDPTGVGNLLGLTSMGEIKQSLAAEVTREKIIAPEIASAIIVAPPVENAAVSATAMLVAENKIAQRSDEMIVTLAPNEGTEIKVELKKGHKVNYVWFTNGGKANFDIHGDSKKLKIDYHGYGKGSKERDEGVIEAAFDGHHGWFWRNRTDKTLTVTLQTIGAYTDIKHLK
ncbi:MAG: transmembrane anchor protein [Gammaproteobacteria bacterium]|nr:transmembrane anchor protein [Gammaproteobacteria bacterium]